MPTLRRAVVLFLPGGLVVAAALVVLRPGVVPGVVGAYVHVWAVLVLLVGVFLGWYYNRGRIVFALLLLTGVNLALRWLGSGEAFRGDAGRLVVAAVAVLLPLNLAAYAVLTERGPLTGGSLTRLVPILAQAVGVGLMARGHWPAVTAWLDHHVVEAGWTEWTAIPQTGVLAFAVAALYWLPVALATRTLPRRGSSGRWWPRSSHCTEFRAGGARRRSLPQADGYSSEPCSKPGTERGTTTRSPNFRVFAH